jgi:hypothetical protein
LELFKTSTATFIKRYPTAASSGLYVDWEKILRMASASGGLADVRFLIEVKAIDINSVDANPKKSYTSLHIAVQYNRLEIAQYLLTKGANPHIKDANQKTPIAYIKDEEDKGRWCEFFNISLEEIQPLPRPFS